MRIFFNGRDRLRRVGDSGGVTSWRAQGDCVGSRSGEGRTRFTARRRPIVGELGKPAAYVAAAEESDVIVHAAIDRSDRSMSIAAQSRRCSARCWPPPGCGQAASFIYTSGVWVLGNTNGPAAEDAPINPTPSPRGGQSEELVQTLSRGGQVRCAIVRPGIVYGGARDHQRSAEEREERSGSRRRRWHQSLAVRLRS